MTNAGLIGLLLTAHLPHPSLNKCSFLMHRKASWYQMNRLSHVHCRCLSGIILTAKTVKLHSWLLRSSTCLMCWRCDLFFSSTMIEAVFSFVSWFLLDLLLWFQRGSIVALAPLLRLVSTLCIALGDGLGALDAMLGCPFIMPSQDIIEVWTYSIFRCFSSFNLFTV